MIFFRRAAYLLQKHSAVTLFRWVKGYNRDIGNEQSDLLAKQGALKTQDDALNLKIPAEFDL